MIKDLSLFHRPISSIFPPVESPEIQKRHALDDEQIESFNAQGYLAGIRILEEEQADILCRELSELTNPLHPGRHLFYEYHSNECKDPTRILFHALGAWRIATGFHDLLWHPAFLVPASQLLAGAVRFWHDQIFSKPGLHGGGVAWHQDYSYWTRTRPMAHLSCWIGLDESTVDNGCLQYIPGSHRWNLLPVTGLTGDLNAIQSVLTEEQQKCFKPVAIALKRGEASFHHPLLVHGSYENLTKRPRRGTVINVCRDGVLSAANEPLLAGVPIIPAGEKLQGQFFPLLFDPDLVA
jgi:Phytanoyl-CoA dioxygenase (PhyH)